jgi:hypothetical protein
MDLISSDSMNRDQVTEANEHTESTAQVDGQENQPGALCKAPPTPGQCRPPTAENAPGAVSALPPSSQGAALCKAPPPPLDRDAVEVSRHIEYALLDSDKRYREPLRELYHAWQENNEQFYQGRLQLPHITIAPTPAQTLVSFRSLSDWGARTQITIDARVVLAAGRAFVHEPYPAEGTQRLMIDLLHHGMVHQYLAEIEHYPDEDNIKHGEAYTEVCNPIGKVLGLPKVVTRHRGPEDAGKPKANAWPPCVRPEGYYLGHVDPPGRGRQRRPPEPRGLDGLFGFILHLLTTGQDDKLAAILQRETSRTTQPACPAKPAAEKGQVSQLNPAWLEWNHGCVRQILHAIRRRKMIDLMPWLADMLEEAGCGDELVLTHCRLPVRHQSDCWVIEALTRA